MPIPYSKDMMACLDAEIEGMIGNGAVEMFNECDDQFISNMFWLRSQETSLAQLFEGIEYFCGVSSLQTIDYLGVLRVGSTE
jgi:hypothetical protein